ncbi:class I SAM-dependent methyltransferase [uncultured Roseivirga sp.]|mgnify:CR=1 FL=1|uniref:class I SAM-dependent methyltransferase n=1 Tax=uncultured Roseivirga sp. TaxID=543088 RepID=UPI0030DCCB6D|tara:strand:- start:131812 stop:132438 length:627 start_codon:yes stop_codon:yes gene_type:complete
MKDNILSAVNDYYTEKVVKHGGTALGVDWNSKESQYLRFEQLSKVIQAQHYSILDYGCGYGEYVNFIGADNIDSCRISYTGYDISREMILKAETSFGHLKGVQFESALSNLKHDYAIASGLFNVRLNITDDSTWYDYILETIKTLDNYSEKGFAFNALTSYSDPEFMKDYLFYADPHKLFNYCKTNFSKNVALLHDYDLYEFTIIVRK